MLMAVRRSEYNNGGSIHMKTLTKDSIIGFIGTGVMGRSMVNNLMKAGYRVLIYTRTKEKAQTLIEAGANWRATVGEVAKDSDVVITMVGYPSDVEEVYFGEKGIIENARGKTLLIDMTTSKPSLAKEIYKTAKTKSLYSLDAPVSGGDIGAKEARLSIMVGGDLKVFDSALPLFEEMGANIVLQGGAGSGQYTKMCNQIAIASGMIGVSEAISYAERAGLDPTTVLKSIESGAAGSWSLTNLAPRMINENYEPGFYVKHFIKDMGIAIESAEELGMETPGLRLAKQLYDQLAENGGNNYGTQALIKLLR
jgi:3-hydroxyisobutyrate dehydrogenase